MGRHRAQDRPPGGVDRSGIAWWDDREDPAAGLSAALRGWTTPVEGRPRGPRLVLHRSIISRVTALVVLVPVAVLALVHSDGAGVTARRLLAHAPGAEALGGRSGGTVPVGGTGGSTGPGRGVRRARCTHLIPSPRAVRRRSARSARISATSSQIARTDAAMPSGQVK